MAHPGPVAVYNAPVTDGHQKTSSAPSLPNGDRDVVLDAVGDECRALRRTAAGRWVPVVIAVVALAPLAVVGLDHGWPHGLPRAVLAAARAVWLVALVVGLCTVILCRLRAPVGLTYAARELERQRGIRHNSVVNAVLLVRDPDARYAHAAAERQAAVAVAGHEPGPHSCWRRFGRPALMVMAALSIWLIYAVLSPKAIGPSLARFLLGRDIPAPTATQLVLLRPRSDDIIHSATPLRFEVAQHGRVADMVRLEMHLGGGESLDHRMLRVPDVDNARAYQLDLPPHVLTRDFEYEITSGDAVLAGAVTIYPRPEISGHGLHVAPPAYTGLPGEDVSEHAVRVLPGTRATLKVSSNVPLRDPVMIVKGPSERRTRMSIDADDASLAMGRIVIDQPGDLFVEFQDEWGYAYRGPAIHSLTLEVDEPPSARIIDPAKSPGGGVDVTRTPAVTALAADDFGLRDVVAVYESADRRAEIPIEMPDQRGQPGTLDIRVPLGDFDLPPGETARLWLRARDNRRRVDGSDASQTARSRAIELINPSSEPALADESRDDPGVENVDSGADEQCGGEDAVSSGAEQADAGDEAQAAGSESTGTSGEASDCGQTGESVGAGDASAAAGDCAGTGGAAKDGDSLLKSSGTSESGAASKARGQGDSGAPAADGQTGEGDSAEGGGGALGESLAEFEREFGEEIVELNEMLGGGGGEAGPGDGATGGRRGERGLNGVAGNQSRDADGNGRRGQGGAAPGDISDSTASKPNDVPLLLSSASPSTVDAGADADAAFGEGAAVEGSDDGVDESSPEEGAPLKSSGTPKDVGGGGNGPDHGDKASSQDRGEGADDDAGPEGDALLQSSGTPDGSGTSGSDAGESVETQGQASSDVAGVGQQPGNDSGQRPHQASGGQPDSAGQDAGAGVNQTQASGDSAKASGQTPGPAGSDLADSATVSGTGGIPPAAPELELASDTGELPEPPAAPADRPQLESFGRKSPSPGMELLERRQEISAEMLESMGWTPARALGFTEALERLEQQYRRKGASADARRVDDLELGTADVQQGVGVSAEVLRRADATDDRRDDLCRIRPPAEQRVSPRLRAVLDAYYESLARERSGEPKDAPE